MIVFTATRTDPRVFTATRTDPRVFTATRTDPRVFTATEVVTPVIFAINSVLIPSTIYYGEDIDCTIDLFNLTKSGTNDLSWEVVDSELNVYFSGSVDNVSIDGRESKSVIVEDVQTPTDDSLVIAIRVKSETSDWAYSNWVDLIRVNIPANPTPRGI